MANNPYNNKIQLSDGTTLIDLTSDTVTAANLAQGVTAHDASGAPITGTMSGGAVIIQDTTDSHGGTIREITATDVVNLQGGKTVTPSTSSQTVTPDTGYDAFESVTVSAMPSGTAGTPTATKGTVSNHSVSITPSVTNTTGYITGGTKTGTAVSVSASELVSGTYSVTSSGTKDVTNYASASIPAGTEGTPTASKGTVSNHSISITPSVTNESGFITGGTKNGTAVTVSASELVSGTYSVTSSGTKDVTNYASASVPSGTEGTPSATKGTVSNHSVTVTPSVTNGSGFIIGGTKTGTAVTVSASELVSGSQTITDNDTYDVTNLASIIVNVAGSGAIEVVTGTFTGTTTGATKNTKLQYDGTGQPVAFMIYPSEGMKNPNGTFNTTIQRYATRAFFAARNILPIADANGSVLTSYKNSADTAESYTQTGTTTQTDNPFALGGASASNARTVAAVAKGSSSTFLYAYIASTSYGFMANIEYTYVVFFA